MVAKIKNINYQEHFEDTDDGNDSINWVDSIGHKFRERRQIKKISLKELSLKSKVSIGQLSQIERGLSSPSIKTLTQICRALDMPFSWLFESPVNSIESNYIVRSAQKRIMDLGAKGMKKEILSPNQITDVQLMRFILHPGSISGDSPAQNSTGSKCGTVLSGSMGLEVNGHKFILHTDDSFAFKASLSYQFWAHGDQDCEVIWVVTPSLY